MATGTLFSLSLPTSGGGFSGVTAVDSIQASAMTLPSGNIIKLRFRLEASASESFTVTNMYIEHRASSGDAYDFAATPTQVLFAGSSSKVIAAGTSEWSDWVNFSYNKIDDLLAAIYCGGGSSSDGVKYKTSVTGASEYEKTANDAATVNKTGYTSNNYIILINNIEYETADAGGNFFPYF